MLIHMDMDAFYASVEVRERPDLAGLPVVVGGTPGQRGVVAAASYEARRHGVHSAMPMSTALKRCPDLVVLPVRMGLYAEESQRIHRIIERYTPLIEPLSLDEAFLDVRASVKLFGPVPEIAQRIKREIRAELGLTASIGIAPVKFAAKIASDLGKPDGFLVVEPDGLRAFLDPLPVARLWGVGRVGEQTMHRLGLRTIADVAARDAAFMEQHFGKHGLHLLNLALGIDPRGVVPEREVKSVSNETTFAADIADRDTLRGILLQLTEQVAWRLRNHGLAGRTVQLKARYADFSTYTRAQTLDAPTDSTDVLWQAVAPLLDRLPRPGAALRLIGMGVSGFDAQESAQPDLFAEPPAPRKVDGIADAIKEKFGKGAVRRATTLKK
ncbi:MAG: DNA polymerase IV [Xanthomonadaceae bacterium]|nr:DNA polymerase IV [Xanthomonadaceae bacterium]